MPINIFKARGGAFLRMLSGGVAVQVLLSASNFLVGLLLIRRTSDADYGYYVLITTAILLSTTLQGSFIQPPMIIRMTHADRAGRADLIGGLYRDQRRLIPYIGLIALLLAAGLWFAHRLSWPQLTVLIAGTLAVMAALQREFFRMVLFAYRRANDVIKGDALYCGALLAGAAVATLLPQPAAFAAVATALAALLGRAVLGRELWRYESWNPRAAHGMLRAIAPQGSWSAFGGGVHWLFSQGYYYLVAAMLDVSAVAALAATRLLIMPVGLLSTGIGTLMLPTVSKWTRDHLANTVLRRLTVFAVGLAALAGIYLVGMWLVRDWLFAHVLKKAFPNRDELLLLWMMISLVTVLRDQFIYFLVTRARFRLSSTLTFVSAVVSLTTSFLAMRHLGARGALIGLLVGELLNVSGIIVFSLIEAHRHPANLPSDATV